MTIGPEPIRQMDSRSGRRGMSASPELCHPGLDERPGVVRARTCFRMELHRPGALRGHRKALDGLVVERAVSDLGARAADGEAVVLGGHQHAVLLNVEHRMVRAAVTERQLVRLEPKDDAEQLMAKADPEKRDAPEQLLDDG